MMMTRQALSNLDVQHLRIGTRGSALAVAQSQTVADVLAKQLGGTAELVRITTHGDLSRAALTSMGGEGVFVGALRQALLSGECDVIVHSLKDLPTTPVDGITLAAVPKRAAVGDALCAGPHTFATLASGARVGTGSPRRVAQVLAMRPDLNVVPLRGNIDSRLARVSDGELDGVVLAEAGLHRLGKLEALSDRIDVDTYPSAPAQGALGIEVRTRDLQDSALFAKALAAINHTSSHLAAIAERAVLNGLGSGCAAPLGAVASIADGLLFLHAVVYSADGTTTVASSRATVIDPRMTREQLDAATTLGADTAKELADQGALELVGR